MSQLRAGLAAIADRAAPVDLTDRVLAESRRLGRRRRVAAAFVVLLVVVVSVSALIGGRTPAPRIPADVVPVPLPTGTLDHPGFQVGDYRPGELADARVIVPAFPGRPECPSGEQQFLGGGTRITEKDPVPLSIVQADRINGLVHALVECGAPGGQAYQVVVFRDTVDGAFEPVDTVVASGEGGVEAVVDLFHNGFQFSIEVADRTGSQLPAAQRQLRLFAWNGNRYVQTGGPTSFPAEPRVVDLTVALTKERTELPDGRSLVTLGVRMANEGEATPARVLLQLFTPADLQPAGEARMWAGCFVAPALPGRSALQCGFDALGPGASRSWTLQFLLPAGSSGGEIQASVSKHSDDWAPERDLADNETAIEVP